MISYTNKLFDNNCTLTLQRESGAGHRGVRVGAEKRHGGTQWRKNYREKRVDIKGEFILGYGLHCCTWQRSVDKFDFSAQFPIRRVMKIF